MIAGLGACRNNEFWVPPSAADQQANLDMTSFPSLEPISVTLKATDPHLPQEASTPDNPSTTPNGQSESPTPQSNSSTLPSLPTDTPILYTSQAADTLPAIAVRFGVQPEDITSTEPIPATDFISPGQLLIIPRVPSTGNDPLPGMNTKLLPDSEVVYSPSTIDFDVATFVNEAGGYLSQHTEWHKSTGFSSGAEVLQRVAIDNSINPRLLLALLEYQSGWVYGQPQTDTQRDYPLGWIQPRKNTLYDQLSWAVNQLSIPYYAWREGRLVEIQFPDGTKTRLAPELNAGTVALQYYFAQLYQDQAWTAALDPGTGFIALHTRMFGDAWERAGFVEPLYPMDVRQPPLNLPFASNWTWSYTGGPHGAWEKDGSYAALDFAPGSTEPGCIRSLAWVTAASSGLVTRSGNGVVVLDLDGDGHEQTGWVLIYLHVSSEQRIEVGTWVGTDDQLGHPSCEGGASTGTHLHIARKYNGEWVPADGPLPFNLGGWIAHAGDAAYQGTLTRDDQTITACDCSSSITFIRREPNDP